MKHNIILEIAASLKGTLTAAPTTALLLLVSLCADVAATEICPSGRDYWLPQMEASSNSVWQLFCKRWAGWN
jgi:hypothetical protein